MAKKTGNIRAVESNNVVAQAVGAHTFKCEEALVAFIVREVNEKGETVSEKTAEPVKVFRASDGANIWGVVDQFLAQTQ